MGWMLGVGAALWWELAVWGVVGWVVWEVAACGGVACGVGVALVGGGAGLVG